MAENVTIARFQDLNPVVHEKTRLAIMTFIVGARKATFSELKSELGLTDGNLNLHMKVLERNGYVKVHKSFVDRRPRTTYELTANGLRAFERHVSLLERILQLGRKGRSER